MHHDLDRIADDARQLTTTLTAEARETGRITTYRNDEAYRAHEPESVYPSGWHRAAAAAAAETVDTAAAIVYRDVPLGRR